jgi:predicted O-methyltransferase YrrM
MTLEEYLSTIDESDPNTTAAIHIAEVAKYAAPCKSIVELGTYQGVSTAAIALAAPNAAIHAIDWGPEAVVEHRKTFWGSLGIKPNAITQIRDDVRNFLLAAVGHGIKVDMIFHDASHGDAVLGEYMTCAKVASIVAIHDFELLSAQSRARVLGVLSPLHESADERGRALFVGASS